MVPRIRPATEADWPALHRLEVERYGPDGYSRYFVRMAPRLFGRFSFVAEAEAVVGYALGGLEDGGDVGWLLSVVIARGAEGQGLGQALSSAAVAALEAAGARAVRLTVAPDNAAALAIYRKLGFVAVAEDPAFFGPDTPRLVMERITSRAAAPRGPS